jgi:hypothetical protein
LVNPLTIVQLNVSVNQAASPILLQNTGAFVSQGGTTEAQNTLTQVATLAALEALIPAPKALTSLTWTTNVATATTTAAHGWSHENGVSITIEGATPSVYNGTFVGDITGNTTVTYPLTTNPGGNASIPGSITLGSATELLEMGTTYFAGLNQQAPYVLELGEGTPADGISTLTTWLTNNPKQVYALLVPREWDAVGAFETLVGNYSAPNSMLYFYTTMVTGDVTGPPYVTPYTGKKSVFGEVEAPTIGATEFSLASYFASMLALSPNSTNRASPMNYPPAYGVTPYPVAGNQSTLDDLIAANVNFINTGSVGGLSTDIQWRGMLQDGSQMIFWYSADYFQLRAAQALSNEVLNGNVPGGNPLYYNQDGINRLQNRLAGTARQAVAAGLANGQVALYQLPAAQFLQNYNAGLYIGQIPINAEPLGVYSAENPDDYGNGVYNGLSAIYTPLTGFLTIGFNLLITDLLVP